jgi:hypothetical protein
MKYTKEQLDLMSKIEINEALLKVADIQHYEQEGKVYYGVKHDGDNVVSICTEFNYEKWQDIMPLAVEHGITLKRVACPAGSGFAHYAESYCGLYHTDYTEPPQRAITCCLILVLQEQQQ